MHTGELINAFIQSVHKVLMQTLFCYAHHSAASAVFWTDRKKVKGTVDLCAGMLRKSSCLMKPCYFVKICIDFSFVLFFGNKVFLFWIFDLPNCFVLLCLYISSGFLLLDRGNSASLCLIFFPVTEVAFC